MPAVSHCPVAPEPAGKAILVRRVWPCPRARDATSDYPTAIGFFLYMYFFIDSRTYTLCKTGTNTYPWMSIRIRTQSSKRRHNFMMPTWCLLHVPTYGIIITFTFTKATEHGGSENKPTDSRVQFSVVVKVHTYALPQTRRPFVLLPQRDRRRGLHIRSRRFYSADGSTTFSSSSSEL